MNDHAPLASPLSKERLRTWLAMLKAVRAVEAELRERMRGSWGTTLPRFDVLAALHRAGRGLTMSELSGALRVSNGNVTGLVDRLVEDAMVRREAVEGDRRASRVCLTDEGRRGFAEMARLHETWVDELLSPLDGADLHVIRSRLARIAETAAQGGTARDGTAQGGMARGGMARGELRDGGEEAAEVARPGTVDATPVDAATVDAMAVEAGAARPGRGGADE